MTRVSSAPYVTCLRDSNATWNNPQTNMLRDVLLNAWTVLACKIAIGAVASYDTYLTLKCVEFLDTYEQNPVGRWLMGLDGGPTSDTQQIAAFVAAKFAGTITVLITLQYLTTWRLKWAVAVAIPVAMLQL